MKRTLYPALAFFGVFFLHGAYLLWSASRWVSLDDASPLSRYIVQQDYFMGLSYGLAAAFTVYSLMRFAGGQRGGLGGTIGGLTMTGILYFAGCFLLGCCGSPMLAVYLSLFGSSYAGFTKPIVLVVTILSIGVSWLWMQGKSKTIQCSKNKIVLIKMK